MLARFPGYIPLLSRMSSSSPVATALRLRIVMPTLDEAAGLGPVLERALDEADEVVVSDGGSADDTVALAIAAGARVVEGEAGRGRQLRLGAAAPGPWDAVLFVHADTLLPEGAGDAVRRAIAAGAVGGGFGAQFSNPRKIYRLGDRLVALRTRLTRCPLGDQAQFVARTAYDALDGIRDWPLLEDLDLARRLKRHGPIELLDARVATSARRFQEQGILRTIGLNWLIWSLYLAGVSPERLAPLYRRVR